MTISPDVYADVLDQLRRAQKRIARLESEKKYLESQLWRSARDRADRESLSARERALRHFA